MVTVERLDDATEAIVDPRFAQPTSLPSEETPTAFEWWGPLLIIILVVLVSVAVARLGKK